MSMKDDKAAMMLTELAARYIAREAGRSTLITPTRTVFADKKRATIYVSVFPETDTPHALKFLMRHRDEFRDFLKKESRFAILPFVTFEEDFGERNRQRLDELGRQL
jgi:ribosome-binding factor A